MPARFWMNGQRYPLSGERRGWNQAFVPSMLLACRRWGTLHIGNRATRDQERQTSQVWLFVQSGKGRPGTTLKTPWGSRRR